MSLHNICLISAKSVVICHIQWGWLIVSLEWLTFVCNHQAGSAWREQVSASVICEPPKIVQDVMAHGFKNKLGFLAISGLHVLPLWLYGMQNDILINFIPYFVSVISKLKFIVH